MGARTDTRQRMIDAAKHGFRTNGVASTSFSDVLSRADAARGAIYHHFPGGRQELTIAVISSTANNVSGALEHAAASTASPSEAFTIAMATLCEVLDREAGGFGCPITPAVLEAAGDHDVLAAGHAAFGRWQNVLVADYGLDVNAATVVVAAVEGALVMCRAARSSEPLRRVGALLADWFPTVVSPDAP